MTAGVERIGREPEEVEEVVLRLDPGESAIIIDDAGRVRLHYAKQGGNAWRPAGLWLMKTEFLRRDPRAALLRDYLERGFEAAVASDLAAMKAVLD